MAHTRNQQQPELRGCEFFGDYTTPRPLFYGGTDPEGRKRVPKGTLWIEFSVIGGTLRMTCGEHTVPGLTEGLEYREGRAWERELPESLLNQLKGWSPDGAGLYVEYWGAG